MKLRRTLAIALALILALSTAALAAEPFPDVPADAYYADAVDWALEKTVTDGMGDGTFAPDAAVTRAQAVTFLWRMAGKPAPTKTETFADVEADGNNWWYKTAVQWAVETGITNGTGEGFSPYVTCSRGMILTMLYRLEERPFDAAMAAVLPENTEDWTMEDYGYSFIQSYVEMLRSEKVYPDVPQGMYYELPIYWATFSGILNSNQIDPEAIAAQPGADCPRGEMVYFLYRASGDAPLEGAIKVGAIPETVALDADGLKITVTGIRVDDLDTAVLDLTVENGSEKLLRVDGEEGFVNTYDTNPQVCIPKEDAESGWTFYADAVVAPGETAACELRLNSLSDKGITAVCELELRLSACEVEKDEDGWYTYADDFADGGTVTIRTSLYEEGVSYDMEGTVIYEKDGLTVSIIRAENNEFSGPEITVYAYNGGSEDVSLGISELKLDGETHEGFFGLSVAAGKRAVAEVSAWDLDYDNIPVVKEAELTLYIEDPETWEPAVVLEPVTVTFAG